MEPIKLIPLHQGRAEVWANGAENQSVHLTYDISNHLKAWPDAQPSVAFERADGEKYPHAWELDGPVLHIPLLLADTEIPGMCKCMITLLSGEGRANTVVFYGSVTQGIDSIGEEPADPMLGIIEQVNLAAADANAAKVGAENAQTAAEEAKQDAQDAAIAAEDSENAAQLSEDAAQLYARQAQEHKDAAAQETVNAKGYADAAAASASAAQNAQTAAGEQATKAQQNAVYAVQAREAANTHAQNAENSAEDANASAQNAENSATAAQQALENMEERYYVPSVDDEGNLSFTPTSNEMTAVPTVNIRGPQGIQGIQGVIGPVGPAGETGPQGPGIPDHTAADAGKILYISHDGNAEWLKVGNGLKIENGTLMLNLTTGDSVFFSENADGSVSLAGVVFTEQDDGSVLLENATFTAQADGSVLIQ